MITTTGLVLAQRRADDLTITARTKIDWRGLLVISITAADSATVPTVVPVVDIDASRDLQEDTERALWNVQAVTDSVVETWSRRTGVCR